MKLQVRRGLKASLPTLAAGEFGFCTDTKELYIGDGTTNHLIGEKAVSGITFNLGVAAVGTKLAQALIPGTLSISTVILWGDSAPTGADLIVDINKNGTTIFTTQANRPKISAGSNSGESGTPNITAFAKGDRLSVDIDQTPAGAGNDLLVTIIC